MSRGKYAQKAVKDLIFLMDLPRTQIHEGITKRLEKEGEGECFGDIKIPCVIYFSVAIYDYEGKLFTHSITNKYNNTEQAQNNCSFGMIKSLNTMKLNESAWFNINDSKLHQINGLTTPGCHLHITIDDFLYKNSDFIQSKRLVHERNAKEGKKLFADKNYEEALKKYKNTLNITENLEKKKYSQQQISQINEINFKAKTNFIRCFIKLRQFDEQTSQQADKCSKQLLEKERNQLHLLLRCKTMAHRKYIDDALDLAKQMMKQFPSQQSSQAYKEIKDKKDRKK